MNRRYSFGKAKVRPPQVLFYKAGRMPMQITAKQKQKEIPKP